MLLHSAILMRARDMNKTKTGVLMAQLCYLKFKSNVTGQRQLPISSSQIRGNKTYQREDRCLLSPN